jgi:multidrug resistance efflux pump
MKPQHFFYGVCAVTILSFAVALVGVAAQSAAPAPAPTPAAAEPAKKPVVLPVPLSSREKVLAAIHKQDSVEKKIAELNAQFMQIQQRAQQQLQALQQQKSTADSAVDAAKKTAISSANLDVEKYDIDADADPMVFTPKPEPKAEAKK